MPAAPVLTFIPDLVLEHFEEVQFLWMQRRDALRSPRYTERELLMLEERIEAHAEGMLAAGERGVELVAPAIDGDNEMPAFAAAVALLRLGSPGALDRVVGAFERATGTRLLAIRDALAVGPMPVPFPALESLLTNARPAVAAAAGEVFAFHGVAALGPAQLDALLDADDSAARAAVLRLVAYLGIQPRPDRLEASLASDDVTVGASALAAAAWSGSPTFAPYSRALAAKPTPESIDALAMFACIAPPEEYQFVGAIATNPAAGPDRFRVVGSFAHPYFIDLLIKEMENPDPAAAISAGAAFFKMTGRDVESNKRVKVSPDGKPPADDFEAEFQDEVFLPDPELARKHWQELAPALAHSPRICRGMDVSQPLSRAQFAALDMESRWEYCLRMRLFSGWQGTPLVLERYPQRF